MRNQASNNNHSQADSTNSTAPSLDSLQNSGEFIARHIGPNETQIQQMLSELKLESLEALVEKTVPESITIAEPMGLAEPMSESAALGKLKNIAAKNKATRSFIGLGYYDTHTPNVILRNVLENPGWYTAYTPYQPEISQGRLECLLNFQQMTLDLTAMDLANASLLDEATAAAEAMALAKRVSKNRKANKFFVDQYCLPQTIDVIKTRAECFGFELIIGDINAIPSEEVFGAIFQYPSAQGQISDLAPIIDELHQHKAIAVVAADLMSLVLLKPPGEMGADVVTGSTQRFGVPMGYGGLTLPPRMNTNVRFPVASLESPSTRENDRHFEWLCKLANNIFAARRPTVIFVLHRCYSPISRLSLLCTMAPKGYTELPAEYIG